MSTLYVNLFRDGSALLECQPQGDASIPVPLPENHAGELAELLATAEVSAALARLFLAGVTTGERNARVTLDRNHHRLTVG